MQGADARADAAVAELERELDLARRSPPPRAAARSQAAGRPSPRSRSWHARRRRPRSAGPRAWNAPSSGASKADPVSQSSSSQGSAMTPQPTTRSPAMRHPICPGAAPPTSRPSRRSTLSCAPPSERLDRARHGRRVVAQPHRLHLSARTVQLDRGEPHAVGEQRGARPHDHPVAARVLAQHVERLGRGDPEAPRWPTVKVWWPPWRPSTRALAVHDLAAARTRRSARGRRGGA